MPSASLADFARGILESWRERKRARRRRREAGVRPGQKVRDGITDRLLRVESISDRRTNEHRINGTPLPDYGDNSSLDCGTDVVVECQSPTADQTYAYPASRIIPLDVGAVITPATDSPGTC